MGKTTNTHGKLREICLWLCKKKQISRHSPIEQTGRAIAKRCKSENETENGNMRKNRSTLWKTSGNWLAACLESSELCDNQHFQNGFSYDVIAKLQRIFCRTFFFFSGSIIRLVVRSIEKRRKYFIQIKIFIAQFLQFIFIFKMLHMRQSLKSEKNRIILIG